MAELDFTKELLDHNDWADRQGANMIPSDLPKSFQDGGKLTPEEQKNKEESLAKWRLQSKQRQYNDGPGDGQAFKSDADPDMLSQESTAQTVDKLRYYDPAKNRDIERNKGETTDKPYRYETPDGLSDRNFKTLQQERDNRVPLRQTEFRPMFPATIAFSSPLKPFVDDV